MSNDIKVVSVGLLASGALEVALQKHHNKWQHGGEGDDDNVRDIYEELEGSIHIHFEITSGITQDPEISLLDMSFREMKIYSQRNLYTNNNSSKLKVTQVSFDRRTVKQTVGHAIQNSSAIKKQTRDAPTA